MPTISSLNSSKVNMYFPEPQRHCSCHINDPPPWTGEIHGLSQALLSENKTMRIFWWLVMIICIICGTTTTILVILEYVEGPTATSTTIKLVDSLELPAITVCPKVPDAFNATGILSDIKKSIPNINEILAIDLVRYWIGGNGLENMNELSYFNRTYLSHLNILYRIWSEGYSTEEFFNLIQEKYGYTCENLFYSCQLAGKTLDCCKDLFVRQVVMRRGLCFQTRKLLNQSEADDIGRLVLNMKALSSITSPQFNFTQPQIIVYVTDNFNHVVDYPRFYLYPHQWNRMRFTARYIELIKNKGICTDKIFGRDAECVIRKWLLSNIIYPFNCTLSYMQGIGNLPFKTSICKPDVIAENYYNNIQLVWNIMNVKEECTPGCRRWDYQSSLQQSQALAPFTNYVFNFEASFNDLQFEYVKEVYTTSIPGLIAQIGGQFGFFLGLSIITLTQMIIYGIHFIMNLVIRRFKRLYPKKYTTNKQEMQNTNLSTYAPFVIDASDRVTPLSQKEPVSLNISDEAFLNDRRTTTYMSNMTSNIIDQNLG